MTDLPDMAARYIGLPFAEHGADWTGVSCWGLVVLWHREEYGIVLPTYDEEYVTTTDRREIAALFAAGVPAQWDPVPVPVAGDAVLFRIGGHPLHCGLWLTAEHFLHCEPGTATCVARFSQPKWRGRVLGLYRHRERRLAHVG